MATSLIAIPWVLLGFLGGSAGAGTFVVDGSSPSCSDAGPGSAAVPYCTISAAISAHQGPGTTLQVQPAVYREQVVVPSSGVDGSPFVLQGSGGAVIEGADDFSSDTLWTPASGDVYLAPRVTWAVQQVFADGQRLTPMTGDVTALPARSFSYVAGTGLYVNVGGGNPGFHTMLVGHRSYGFRVAGRAWVTIDGFTVKHPDDRGIYVTSSSHVSVTHNAVSLANRYGIQLATCTAAQVGFNQTSDNGDHGIALTQAVSGSTIESNESFANARRASSGANGLYLFGSPDNVIQRNRFHHNQDTGLQIQSSSNNTISLENRSWSNGDHGIHVINSTGTVEVGDVAWGNTHNGIAWEGGSIGASLFNCITAENGTAQSGYDLFVDSTSTAGWVSNDNVIWNATPQAPVRYGQAAYPTVSSFSSATGQDTRSIQSDPLFVDPAHGDFHLTVKSPAIDSGNSSVPNWPSTDAEGAEREDEPNIPNTGTGSVPYADRGALEYRNRPPVANLVLTPVSGTAPLEVTADASGSIDPDGTIVGYQFDFGDSSVASSQTTGTATHTFAGGVWTVRVDVVDNGGRRDVATGVVNVTVPNQAPNGVIDSPPTDTTIVVGDSLRFRGTGNDPDGNLPLSFAWDFGGAAPNRTIEDPGDVLFNTPGIYTIKFTVTDRQGLSDPTPAVRTVTVAEGHADEIHWTYTGQNSVAIDWRGSDKLVRYGLTAQYGQTVTGNPPDIYPLSSIGPFWEAELVDLQEDTTYHYAIGNGPDHTFRTPPPRGGSGFTVDVEADIGASDSYFRMPIIQQIIADGHPTFVLAVGDLTYGNAHGPIAVDAHFNDVMVWSVDSAYMPIWGNHEWEDPGLDDLRNYKGRFDLPNPQAATGSPTVSCCDEDWYWFDYGNVRFIAYPEPWPGAWSSWFPAAQGLMDDAEADTAITFIVTFGHRPAYSSGHHPGSDQLKTYLDALGSTHPKYVLNLNGHSHNYERTFPQSGVVHITAGGGGGNLEEDPSGDCIWRSGCPPPSWSAFRAYHHSVVRLYFNRHSIRGETICGPPGDDNKNKNDVICDQGSVMDQFEIIAPDTVVTGVPLEGIPSRFALAQNAPNPFASGTTFRYDLPVPALVRIAMFDLSGRRIASLVDSYRPAGRHLIGWQGRDESGARLPNGVYFVRMQSGAFRATRKVILER